MLYDYQSASFLLQKGLFYLSNFDIPFLFKKYEEQRYHHLIH